MKLLVLFFVLTPFTKFLPLETYNQPYAVAVGLLVLLSRPSFYGALPQIDRFNLGYFLILGVTLFFASFYKPVGLRELQYLLIYTTPAILVPVIFQLFKTDRQKAIRVIVIGIVVWVGVGLVQLLYNPDFLVFLVATTSAELGSNAANSGRGVLGLSPEPSHFGLHMLVLAATLQLIGGPKWASILAVTCSLFLAKSSMALLVIGAGLLLWSTLEMKRWPFIAATAFVGFMSQFLAQFIFSTDSRVGRLLTAFSESGGGILNDYSVNARLYGIYSPIAETISHFLVPLGMSQADWLNLRDLLVAENSNIVYLSSGGPASGYGIVFVQAGLFSIPILWYFFRRICYVKGDFLTSMLACFGFMAYLGQINLSTPTFSLLLAAALFAHQKKRENPDDQNSHPRLRQLDFQSVQ